MALFEPCLLSDGKLCAAVKFFSLVKRNRDLAGFCGMDILTVGTDLFLEDPAIGKNQLFHFTRFGGTSFTSSQEKYTILYVLCKYVLKDKMRTKWKKPGDFKESSSFFLAE